VVVPRGSKSHVQFRDLTDRYLCACCLPNCLGGRLVNQARMFGSPVYIYSSYVCFFFTPVAAVGVECANLIAFLLLFGYRFANHTKSWLCAIVYKALTNFHLLV